MQSAIIGWMKWKNVQHERKNGHMIRSRDVIT